MVELVMTSPLEGRLPAEAGPFRLTERTPLHITSIMPFAGRKTEASNLLREAHGMALPAPGRSGGKASLRAVWTGAGQWFLIGNTAADVRLAECAALTDQSDGWVTLALEGAGVEQVLARLTPLDLRAREFKRGHAARSELAHMMAIFMKTSGGFEIMVMRSLARTACAAILDAMESTAATAAIA